MKSISEKKPTNIEKLYTFKYLDYLLFSPGERGLLSDEDGWAMFMNEGIRTDITGPISDPVAASTSVPEPSSVLLLSFGLGFIGFLLRRKAK